MWQFRWSLTFFDAEAPPCCWQSQWSIRRYDCLSLQPVHGFPIQWVLWPTAESVLPDELMSMIGYNATVLRHSLSFQPVCRGFLMRWALWLSHIWVSGWIDICILDSNIVTIQGDCLVSSIWKHLAAARLQLGISLCTAYKIDSWFKSFMDIICSLVNLELLQSR